tara:strand:+ start:365 stop:604 length:240 start_codon:yes stop_codon:yes gene_type:complete
MNKPHIPLEKYLEQKLQLVGEMYWITNSNLCYIDNDGNLDDETMYKELKEEIRIVNGFLREYKLISKQYRDVFENEENK